MLLLDYKTLIRIKDVNGCVWPFLHLLFVFMDDIVAMKVIIYLMHYGLLYFL